MDYIIFMVPIILLVVFFGKELHKYQLYFYGVAALITLIVVIFLDDSWVRPLTSPGIGISFFILVMYVGALEKKSKIRIMFTKVRKEMAILGYIFIIPHVLTMFTWRFRLEMFMGSLAILSLTPLFITSFGKVKKMLGKERWNKLHKLAYLSYLLIFLHTVLITLLFNKEYGHTVVYILVFLIYSVLRFKNVYLHKKRVKV